MNACRADFFIPFTALIIVSGLTSIFNASAITHLFLLEMEKLDTRHRIAYPSLSSRLAVGSSCMADEHKFRPTFDWNQSCMLLSMQIMR